MFVRVSLDETNQHIGAPLCQIVPEIDHIVSKLPYNPEA